MNEQSNLSKRLKTWPSKATTILQRRVPQPSPTGRGSKGEGVQWRVSVEGFDYYNTKTGGIESGGAGQIAVWLLDTDYDGRSL